MSARQKAKNLVELAADSETPDNERMAAAMKLVKLIRKYDLLSSPLDGFLASDNETVSAAADIFSTLTNPSLVNNVKKIANKMRRRR